MQRDDLRVRLRQRSEWEALELGREMFRRWSASAYRAWAASYAPVAAIVILLTWPWPSAAPWVLWWLKPFFDRVLLFVYSQHVFGRPATLADLRRALPGILFRSGLFSALTFRRLSPSRSLLLPIWQLEGQGGRAARERARVIGRRPFLYAAWLTLVCATLSFALVISLALIVWVFTPVGLDDLLNADFWTGPLDRWSALSLIGLTALADSVVEPLYVASGFSLYLNRRSDLEAWDLELGFRGLADRLAGSATARPGHAAAVLVIGIGLLTGTAVSAQNTDPRAAQPSPSAVSRDPKLVIRDVLADPVFGVERDELTWQPKKKSTPTRELPGWLGWIGRQVERVARLARLAVWPVAAALVAWLVVLWQRQRPGVVREADAPPDVIFGIDVRPESLPADVPAHARTLIAQGQVTAALGLLYRAALSALIHRHGVRFSAGDTEGECVHRARPVLSSPSLDYFRALIASWQLAAYARVPPGATQALALCDEWTAHFGAGRQPA